MIQGYVREMANKYGLYFRIHFNGHWQVKLFRSFVWKWHENGQSPPINSNFNGLEMMNENLFLYHEKVAIVDARRWTWLENPGTKWNF